MSSDLLEHVFAAHGGLKRWRQLSALRAHARCGGLAMSVHSQQAFRRCEIMMSTKEPWVVFAPGSGRGAGGRRAHMWIEHNRPWSTRLRASAGTVAAGSRSELVTLHAGGAVMWRYLCTPFLLALPDVSIEELASWREGGERWQRLLMHMPEPGGRQIPHILYVDRRGFIRRHDCPLPGGRHLTTAHYCGRHRAFGGLIFPTRRRVYPRLPGGQAAGFPPLAWIDIDRVDPVEEAPDCA